MYVKIICPRQQTATTALNKKLLVYVKIAHLGMGYNPLAQKLATFWVGGDKNKNLQYFKIFKVPQFFKDFWKKKLYTCSKNFY